MKYVNPKGFSSFKICQGPHFYGLTIWFHLKSPTTNSTVLMIVYISHKSNNNFTN